MRSHFMPGRGLAMSCAAVGAAAIPAAVCSAQLQFAADNSSNASYIDGWQVGDNGGFGFGPWNMAGTANTPVQHSMSTSPYNQTGGLAWTLFNPNGRHPDGPGNPPPDPNSNPPSEGTDISQAGRAILGGLQIGQTIATVIDNPTERRFFRGYTVRLNTGGGNTNPGDPPVSRLAIGTFEYFSNGRWNGGDDGPRPTLFDTDTDGGLRIDVTLTGVDTYNLVMTPLDGLAPPFIKSATLDGPPGSTIDWIEFELYNTDSDFFNVVGGNTVADLAEPAQNATDFYIRSIEVTGIPEPSASVWLLAATALTVRRLRRRGNSG